MSFSEQIENIETTWTGHLPADYKELCQALADEIYEVATYVDFDQEYWAGLSVKIIALADRAWRNGAEVGADMFGGDMGDGDPDWVYSDTNESDEDFE